MSGKNYSYLPTTRGVFRLGRNSGDLLWGFEFIPSGTASGSLTLRPYPWRGDSDAHLILAGRGAGTVQLPVSATCGGSIIEQQGNRGVASGYCPLDSWVLVPTSYLGSGTPSSSNFLRGDRSWATPTGTVPAAHASSHASGGSDSLKLDDLAAPDDNTDLNASASAHGLLLKLSGVATEFLSGAGSWLSLAGRSFAIRILTSGTAATYTPTSGATRAWVRCWGGGGGGGGAAATAASAAAGGGGGAGGYGEKYYSSLAASYQYSIGAGGAGGTAGANDGAAGADTTFDEAGTVLTAQNGAAGKGCAAGVVPAVIAGGSGGTVASNCDINGAGQSGLPGRVWNGTVAESGQGGSTSVGSGGAACITERNGIAGAGPGGGGSGGCSYGGAAKSGGAGKDGLIAILEFT